ncbi:MAG: hypothetical protein DWI11_01845 [Planctomycetota bacterium]|nr:MAG: hypothetical protein DWI11_01845 [Planctomycetota bacterium]
MTFDHRADNRGIELLILMDGDVAKANHRPHVCDSLFREQSLASENVERIDAVAWHSKTPLRHDSTRRIDRLLASALHIEYDSVLHHLVRKSVEIAIDKDSDGSKAAIDAREFLE